MNSRICITCAVFIVLGFILAGGSQSRLAGEDKGRDSGSTKWEYKVEKWNWGDNERLDDLGEQGWELVGATTASPTFGQVVYFKRQK